MKWAYLNGKLNYTLRNLIIMQKCTNSSVQNDYLLANANRRQIFSCSSMRGVRRCPYHRLDTDEGVSEGYCDGTQVLIRDLLISSAFSLGCTIAKGLKGLVQ